MSEENKQKKKNFLFAGILVLGLFLFFEILARLVLGYGPLFYKIHGNIQGLDDASQRIQWVRAHRGDPKEVLHVFNRYSPTRGWEVIPDIDHMTVYGSKTLSTNSKGLRGTEEFSYEKTPGKVRAVVLGDSFVFGDEVSDDETTTYYLSKMLPELEVINTGVSGYGHDQMLLYWREEGYKYKPDIVILGFVYYDMERNLRSFRFYAKPRFVLSGGQLKLRDSPPPSGESLLRGEFFRLKSLDLAEMVYQRIAWKLSWNEKKMYRLSRAIIDKIVEEVKESGAVPVLAFFCNEDDFENYFKYRTPHEKFFFDYCEDRGLRCLSVRPDFIKSLKSGEVLDTYGHWGPRGHEIAAGSIRDYLVKENLVSETGGPPDET